MVESITALEWVSKATQQYSEVAAKVACLYYKIGFLEEEE